MSFLDDVGIPIDFNRNPPASLFDARGKQDGGKGIVIYIVDIQCKPFGVKKRVSIEVNRDTDVIQN